MSYFYSIAGTDVVGPLGEKELRVLFEAGALPPTTQICAEDATDWRPLAKVFSFAPPPKATPPIRTRGPLVAGIALGLLLAVALGYFLGQYRALSSRVAVSAIFTSELTKFLDEGAKTKALAHEGAPLARFQEQLAHTTAAFDAVRAAWPGRLPAGSRPHFEKALAGWELASRLSQYQAEKADEPTEPDISSYARFVAFAPDELVVQTRDADYAVKKDRFRHYLPYAQNREVLLNIAAHSFDAGRKETLAALR